MSEEATGFCRFIYKDPNQPIEARVVDLLSHMSLKEKVGQMTCIENPDAGASIITDLSVGAKYLFIVCVYIYIAFNIIHTCFSSSLRSYNYCPSQLLSHWTSFSNWLGWYDWHFTEGSFRVTSWYSNYTHEWFRPWPEQCVWCYNFPPQCWPWSN